MAAIEKLQIRGIRSFSPHRDETIEFYSPLTMIVGANGCGKTTIIEALKFVCSGVMPPGARNGQSFVNDPTMTESTEVKAHIKLRFTNISGDACVAVRQLQLSKKKSKLEYKQLDGVVKTTDLSTGKRASISMKCGELDKHIPELLGVSAPIMDNVIFCHQEESSWPMTEGAVLKKKFDDIFESTRYAKALEALAKTKKEFQSKAKDLKGQMMEFAAHLHAANQYKLDLSASENSREECIETIEKLDERIDSMDGRISKASSTIKACRDGLAEFDQLQQQLRAIELRVEERRTGLEREYTESDEELQDLLENFEEKMRLKSHELRTLQGQVDNMNSDIVKLRERTDELNMKQGMAQSISEQFKLDSAKYLEMVGVVSRKQSLAQPVGGKWSATSARDFLGNIQTKIDDAKREFDTAHKNAAKLVEDQSKIHSAANLAVVGVTHKLETISRDFERTSGDLDQRRSIIANYASARAQVTTLERNAMDDKKNWEEYFESFPARSKALKQTAEDARKQIEDLTSLYNNDSELLQSLSMRRNETIQAETAMNQINSDYAETKGAIANLFKNNRKHLGEAQAPDDHRGLDTILADLSNRLSQNKRELEQSKKNLAAASSEAAGVEAILNEARQREPDLNQKVNTLEAEEAAARRIWNKTDQIIDVVRPQLASNGNDVESLPKDTLAELIAFTKACVDGVTFSKTILDAQKHFKGKFAKKSKSGKCACCEQSIEDATVAGTYTKNMEKLLDVKGHELPWEETKQKLVAHLGELEPFLFKLRDLPEARSNFARATETIQNNVSKLRDLRETERTLREDVTSLEATVTAMDKMITSMNEIKLRWLNVADRKQEAETRQRRASQSIMTGQDPAGRTMERIEQDQRRRLEEKEAAQREKDKATADESEITKRCLQLKEKMMESEKELAEVKRRGEKYANEETAIRGLEQELTNLERSRREAQTERDEKNREVQERSHDLQVAKGRLADMEKAHQVRTDDLRSSKETIQRLSDSLEELYQRSREYDLDTVTAEHKQVHASIQEKEEQVKIKTPQINAINSEIFSQERTKRVVRENLSLREARREKAEMQAKIRTVGENTATLRENQNTAFRDQQRAEQERQKCISERDTLKGKIEIYQQQAREYNAKLEGPNYADVHEKHRKKSIEYETTEMAVKDLESYYTALDKALQNFHTLKIKEINKIIRELWQLIYKGQDIDNIELESGVESGASASAKGSRSYNYRVVMRKGDTPLDMRGRCSAGQRVLAAIVIRLALAETFCLNCGILALDEPTTNLDEPNKSGLAHALARIILSRSKQQNFQLICITHDEDFVKLMAGELSASSEFSLPENYFRISRKEEEAGGGGGAGGTGGKGKYFSKIERISWQYL